MARKRCTHCRTLFCPSPRNPNQTYCSDPEWQKARKRDWQKRKMREDKDYRLNQKDSQERWTAKRPDYWGTYRKQHPEYVLHSSIFFDFRSGYGDKALVNELKDFLLQSTGGWMGFFRHLAENALHFKPPLDFFGNFALQGKGEHKTVWRSKPRCG